jgi:hypothetical protein
MLFERKIVAFLFQRITQNLKALYGKNRMFCKVKEKCYSIVGGYWGLKSGDEERLLFPLTISRHVLASM